MKKLTIQNCNIVLAHFAGWYRQSTDRFPNAWNNSEGKRVVEFDIQSEAKFTRSMDDLMPLISKYAKLKNPAISSEESTLEYYVTILKSAKYIVSSRKCSITEAVALTLAGAIQSNDFKNDIAANTGATLDNYPQLLFYMNLSSARIKNQLSTIRSHLTAFSESLSHRKLYNQDFLVWGKNHAEPLMILKDIPIRAIEVTYQDLENVSLFLKGLLKKEDLRSHLTIDPDESFSKVVRLARFFKGLE